MRRTRNKLCKHEPIQLTARRHNGFPQRSMWRGGNYDVAAVQENVDQDATQGNMPECASTLPSEVQGGNV